MSSKKVMIFGFGFIAFLTLVGAGIQFILQDFDTLAVEGIQFEKTVGYVRLDRLTVPVSQKGKLKFYLFVDSRIELADDGLIPDVQARLPEIRDAILRDFHKKSVAGADNPVGIDIRGMKKRMIRETKKLFEDKVITTIFVTKVLKAAG